MRELVRTRVGDDELDIQVGSCICLNVFLFWNIALHLGRDGPIDIHRRVVHK